MVSPSTLSAGVVGPKGAVVPAPPGVLGVPYWGAEPVPWCLPDLFAFEMTKAMRPTTKAETTRKPSQLAPRADANTAEDADGGQDGGHADKAQEEASQEGNVEASFGGFLRVDAPVLSLGQEEPRQAVGERHEGQAQGCDDGEDSHERQVPSAACSDARADAADDARMGSVPAGGSHGLKETLAGRTLSVGTALVRRTV